MPTQVKDATVASQIRRRPRGGRLPWIADIAQVMASADKDDARMFIVLAGDLHG
jgi:hypothetical protein